MFLNSTTTAAIPAKAGIHEAQTKSIFILPDSRLRGNDKPSTIKCSITQRGFTLLETLVALAILAIALAAILRTAGAETRHAEDLRLRLLADWVAQNRLALHAARGDWLAIGAQNGEETQAGVRLLWREEIGATPNPAFRRIEVGVFVPGDEQHALRKLTGYLVERRRN